MLFKNEMQNCLCEIHMNTLRIIQLYLIQQIYHFRLMGFTYLYSFYVSNIIQEITASLALSTPAAGNAAKMLF